MTASILLARLVGLALALPVAPVFAGGEPPPVEVLWRETLSTRGSTRGTAYGMSAKIITSRGRIFAAWLDHVADARIATCDLGEGTWSEPLLLGRGVDNHSGPALTMDSGGYLYAIFGPHGRDPFQLRRSLRPRDASEWSPAEPVGARATYPSLACGPDDALHLTYRGNPMPARLMYQRRPAGGSWSEPRELVSADVPSGYTQYGNPLAVGADGTLHLAFHVYDMHPAAGKAAGYLRSRDGGSSWETAEGLAVELPADPSTPCFIEQGKDLDVRAGSLALDPRGRPHVIVLHRGAQPQDARLWRHDGSAWRSTELLPFVRAAMPEREIGDGASLSFDARGRLYVALAVQTPPGGWGHPSGEVVLLCSDDGGESFDLLPISPPDPELPAWLPSIERPHGPDPLEGVPSLLYTHGGPGEGVTGGEATEIVFVRLGEDLEAGFRSPPAEARPWVYWFWVNGNITREGITADLEAMAGVGIGGVLIMEVDIRTPAGPAPFGGGAWRELFRHVCAEADRLGLEVVMNNDAGWCGSGGPWIPPELSMQKVVWTETACTGPSRFEGELPRPEAVRDHYRDIAVLAFPTPAGDARITNLAVKAGFHAGMPSLAVPTGWPEDPEGEAIPRAGLLDLTDGMDEGGRLSWEVPEGEWTLLRFGHTSTGRTNHPAPAAGRGLECDKLSAEAAEAHFDGLMGKLVDDVGPLTGEALVGTHIDSWEVGSQNWTPRFREEFLRLRGYDPLPFLPVLTGRIVDRREVSERFLWDLRQTVSELLLENYAGRIRELAHEEGLRLSIEAYHTCPTNDMAYAGRADEPMGEFWSWWWPTAGYEMSFSCTEMASAAHVYGRRIVGAEAFTATDAERWQSHPGSIKALGDWAFCEGINRFVFHRFALQPWPDRPPGMSMGPWGLHYERTQTWWDSSVAWHEYLARCQFLLRQGLFVADVCYLGPEGAPQSIAFQDRFLATPGDVYVPRERGGYNFDACPPEALLTRMSVEDGRLVLPDGMSYRLLVLPAVETMTPELLRRVMELVEAGATVVGPRPVRSPSLEGHPRCDEEVRALARELFGPGELPETLEMRPLGEGTVVAWRAFDKRLDLILPAGELLREARWIWSAAGRGAMRAPPGKTRFRRAFELSDPQSIESARLVMTADNAFECWLNGERVGEGRDHQRLFELDVSGALRSGSNLLAVEVDNWTESPNPAALIGALQVEHGGGESLTLITDEGWEFEESSAEDWTTNAAAGAWSAASPLGALGMAPWGEPREMSYDPQMYAEEEPVARVMEALGVPMDFDYRTPSGERSLRFIHRRAGKTDIYFVANRLPRPERALCRFRVSGMQPELWWPDTGRVERVAVCDELDGATQVPISFGPADSVFVVFREPSAPASRRVVSARRGGRELLGTGWGSPMAVDPPGIQLWRAPGGALEACIGEAGTYFLEFADGGAREVMIELVPAPLEVAGPWELRFAAGGGAPERIELEELVSWSEHGDEGVRHFSGAATYSAVLDVPAEAIAPDRRFHLDLGDVQVAAEVRLNGIELGILWKPPYRVEVTEVLRAGENRLEVEVVNLWINRMIGDQRLPEDSDRDPAGWLRSWPEWLERGEPSPAGRTSFTSWRLWKGDEPLVESGLLGPVRIIPSLRRSLD